MNHSNAELIQHTLNGKSEAFGELVQRYQDAVYATALHNVKDFAVAQDIAQEAFIEAYKGLHTLREPARFPGWLHTITLRQCGRWRRKRRESRPIDNVEEPQPETAGPDEEMEREELRRIVLNAIASLPEKAGEVVTMYYIDGLSYNEIASFLSVPASTVKGRLQMGRKQLKEELVSMVEDSLKQNRPDRKFTEKVLAEIIEQANSARKRDSHDEVIHFCHRALETLDNLNATEDHRRTRMDVLNWQGSEWLWWFGEPEKAAENFQYAAQIAADIGVLEAQVNWLLLQTLAISRTGNYEAMREPLQKAHAIYDKLGDTQAQVACGAVLDLVGILPDNWDRIHIDFEKHTSYGSKQHTLVHSTESLTYDHEPLPSKKFRILGLVRRGYHALPDKNLLERVGQPAQILSFPMSVGDSWSGQVKTRSDEMLTLTRTVEADDDMVVVPAGRFENCLRIVTVGIEQADADLSDDIKTYNRRILCGTRTMWFAPGVGLVKYFHYSDRGSVSSIMLTEYQVENLEKDSYFPLSIGNRWKYERCGDGDNVQVTESYRVAAQDGERYHISCAIYSELLDDAAQRDYFRTEYESGPGDAFHERAWTSASLAGAYARLGDMEAALEAYGQADDLAAKSGDAKLQFHILFGTDWKNPPELVLERHEMALKIAEEMGDLSYQDLCLGSIFDISLRHQRGRWYTKALDAAQRKKAIAARLGDHAGVAFSEASADLAQALMTDSEGELALNGGIRLGFSEEISDEEVRFSIHGHGIGHIYDRPSPPIWNDRFWLYAPLLKLPVKVGEKWSRVNGHESMVERTIESDSETVSVPADEFDGTVRVKSVLQSAAADEGSAQANEIYNSEKGFRDGEKWMWFAPGVGIVKAEHHHANGKRTVIELVDYHITEPGDAYFPLAVGNIWNYEWRNEDGDLLFKEQQRVVLEHEGKFYLAVSGYTTNIAEYGEHKY